MQSSNNLSYVRIEETEAIEKKNRRSCKIDTLKDVIAQDDINDNTIVFWSSNTQLRCLMRFDDQAFFLDL